MRDSTVDQRQSQLQCADDQQKFVSAIIGAIIDVKKINEDHQSLNHRVVSLENLSIEHKAKIEEIHKFSQENAEKILHELNASREFREKLEPWIQSAKPYMNTLELWNIMPVWPKRFMICSILCMFWLLLSMLNPSISPEVALKLFKSWVGV